MAKTYMYGRFRKGHQCIKATSLYETLKIQHPSFKILIIPVIIIIIIIIITFSTIVSFSLLSNGALQQQLLFKNKKKLITVHCLTILKLRYAIKFKIIIVKMSKNMNK